jgi:RNA polymerase sigma factor (sigma-70 family)
VGRSNDQHLRRFVQCRDRGDTAGAVEAWDALVVESFDRVRQMVAAWGRNGRLSPEERDDAVQDAFIKLWKNMINTFEGESMGQFVRSLERLVEFACLDVVRRAARRSAREPSLDELTRDDEGDERGRFTRAEYDEAAWQQLRESEKAEAEEFVGWALSEMKNERRADVLRHTLAGTPEAEIAAEFDTTLNNVQALRSRGMKDLRKLKERYES